MSPISLLEPTSASPRRAPATADWIGARQLSTRTGVATERIRTWSRRFGYPASGSGAEYPSAEVPGVIAVKQLIEFGYPAREACEIGSRWREFTPDVALLERTFDPLGAAVFALQVMEPLSLIYANRAAAVCGGPQSADDLPLALQRELRALATHTTTKARTVWLPPVGEGEREREALAMVLGPPHFLPATLVVIDVSAAAEGRTRSVAAQARLRATERALVEGLRHARRTLQTQPGTSGVRPAMSSVLQAAGAADGFLVVTDGGGTARRTMSDRGELPPSHALTRAGQHLDHETAGCEAAWLSPALTEALGAGEGACLALPMLSGGQRIGHLCLQFPAAFELGDTVTAQLASFGSLLASVLAVTRR